MRDVVALQARLSERTCVLPLAVALLLGVCCGMALAWWAAGPLAARLTRTGPACVFVEIAKEGKR